MNTTPIRTDADLSHAMRRVSALRDAKIDASGHSPQPTNARRVPGVMTLMQHLYLANDGSDVMYTGLVFAIPLPDDVAIISPLSRPEVLCTVPLAMLRPCGG